MEVVLEGAKLSVYLWNAQISGRAGYCTNIQFCAKCIQVMLSSVLSHDLS